MEIINQMTHTIKYALGDYDPWSAHDGRTSNHLWSPVQVKIKVIPIWDKVGLFLNLFSKLWYYKTLLGNQIEFPFHYLGKIVQSQNSCNLFRESPLSPFLVKNNNNFLCKLYWYITGGPILGNPFEIPFLKLGKIVQSQTTCNHFRESPRPPLCIHGPK